MITEQKADISVSALEKTFGVLYHISGTIFLGDDTVNTLKRLLCLTLAGLICLSVTACAGKPASPHTPNTHDEEREIVMPEDVNIKRTVTVSPLNRSVMNGGVFEGWGTSLCWWANRVGYSDKLAQLTADLFFSEEGLGLNIMRYNIGGGDDPKHTHITRTDSMVPGWLEYDKATGETTWNYNADKNQLNVLERCYKAAGEDALVEVFSNSPPYFMTVSGCTSGGHDPNRNNLKEESNEEFAEYLAHVTDYIQNKMGITVDSVSPMNEPNTNFWGYGSYKQEGCHFDAGIAQSKIIEATYEALKQYDLGNVIVSASDETSTGLQIDEYKNYSEKARKAVGRINTHTYQTQRIGELGQLAKDEGFNLWMSEVDGNGFAGVNSGEMGAALWLGEKIISDINALSPSAWVLWQVIDKHICEEGYLGRQDSGMIDTTQGFWGTAVCDHDEEKVILTQKYYAFGQFTRYIRPGANIIHCGGGSLAAYHPETKELTIVSLNTAAEDIYANFSLNQLEKIGDSVRVIRTSGSMADGEHWAELDPIYTYDKGFVAELKANSVTTFIVPDVEMGEISLSEVSIKGATATGSKPWNNGSDDCTKVIDSNSNSFFDGLQEGWVEVDLGGKKSFDVLAFAPRAGFEGRMVGGKFYGSNDGKSWKEIYEVVAAPAAGLNYIFLDKELSYKFLRYDVPAGRPEGANEDYLCNIAEIALYSTK